MTGPTHATTKCPTCGHDSCRGNHIAFGKRWRVIEVCSRCRQPLKEKS
jgi:endogenous inhibitor of DNA gyrase (YacG/DUF329 family)